MGVGLNQLIEHYEKARDEHAAIVAEWERRRAEVLTTVQDQLIAIENEFATKLVKAIADFNMLEAQIKPLVLAEQKTAAGNRWMFVYNKPRVTWDTLKLEGLALMFPPLLECRHVGEASIAVRERKP